MARVAKKDKEALEKIEQEKVSFQKEFIKRIEQNAKPNKGGRKPKITPAVLQDLCLAFSIGCTDEQACMYAGIGTSTLYNYQNANEEFVERKRQLKESVVIMSKMAVYESVKKGNLWTAQWLLERLEKDNYSTRQETTGKNGEPIKATIIRDDIK